MIWYETLMLAKPDITSDEETTIRDYFEQLVSKQEGKLISFEKWGKYLLTYPVKKQDYGTHFLARFALPANVVNTSLEDMKTFFKIKCTDIVMRYINKRLAKGFPLDYQKPEPVDSVSTSFSKEERSFKEKEDREVIKKDIQPEEVPSETGSTNQEKVES